MIRPMFPRLSSTVAALGVAFACALPPAGVARAEGNITIYRCVDANGAVTLQNDTPCPKSSKQEIRKVAALPTMATPTIAVPPPPAPPPNAAPPPAAPEAPAPQVARTPPQPLWQCRTWDQRDYFSDDGEAKQSCVPVQSVGIDGTSGTAAGSTCEMQQDECTAVPSDLLCVAWKKRVDEAEFRWKFAGARNDDRKVEFDRLSKLYRDSSCGG